MNEILRYLKDLEFLIYFVLGTFAVWQLRKFYLAWEELRAAAFGLEKESAQMRINRSAALLVVLLFLVTAEFGLVSYIIPAMPDVEPLPTATLDLLATPTITLAVDPGISSADIQETQSPGAETIPTGCIPEEVMITYPENDSTVQDIVEVEGTVNIADFGFYKFEISEGDTANWLTIQAGDLPKEDEKLGFWDTTQLEPGNYYLRLVVIDNQGIQREPCAVYLYVDSPSE
ncbi:MAG: hypothetical protein MUO54_06230 [Anaerolineales bacterium]|nr:hypothetical protein [Anaerolineales bacterium]